MTTELARLLKKRGEPCFYEELNQNKDIDPNPKKKRLVAGVACWPKLEGGKTVVLRTPHLLQVLINAIFTQT